MRIFCLFLIVIALIPIKVAGFTRQVSGDNLTAAEELEVGSFVKSFSDHLRLTRNLTPFLNEPVARNVLDKTLADKDMSFVKHDIALKVGRDELRRFYIALTNLGYLSNLYIYSKLSLKGVEIRDFPYEKQYPPSVFRLLKSNPTLAVWWNGSASFEPEKVISSVEQLRSLVITGERAAQMMRRYFKSHPPERSRTYQKNVSYLAPYLKEIKVETCKTGEDCLGFPVHTQFISVPLPVLRLELVRVNGQLKIMIVGLLDED
jgi:hypothetical protein